MDKRTIGPVTTNTTASAALTVVLFYVIKAVWGIEPPGEVQGAVTILIVLVAGYITKPRVVAPSE